jgi:hypothetical protein
MGGSDGCLLGPLAQNDKRQLETTLVVESRTRDHKPGAADSRRRLLDGGEGGHASEVCSAGLHSCCLTILWAAVLVFGKQPL